MLMAIISDIHSNLEALETVIAHCEERGVEEYACLGDVVGYGSDPNPCCEKLREITKICLLGNHDAAVIGAMEESYYYKEAKDAILWTRSKLTEENFSWLFSRPYSAQSGDYGFFHSAPVHPSGFYYMVHEGDAAQQMRVLDKLTRYTFIGHSHLTQSFLFNKGGVQDITGKNVVPQEDEKVIVTVGSVGQPRDRNPELCFVLLDTESGAYEHVRLEYDVATAAGKIRDAGLSQRFADRLFEGV